MWDYEDQKEKMSVSEFIDLRRSPVHPFIKYVGGKRQLLSELDRLIPSHFNRYFEPFVGAGTMFFRLVSSGSGRFTAYLSDANAELITTWLVIRDNPKGLIELLQGYKNEYMKYPPLSKEQEIYYYLLRDLYNNLVLYTKSNTLQSIKSNSKKYKKDSNYLKRLEDLYDNLVLSISKGQSSRDVEIAAMLITLNKTCYNGLYRDCQLF
jgi:site-specific DNA-adenine methylase